MFWSKVKGGEKKKNQLWGNVSDADKTFWAKAGSRESRRQKRIQEVSATSHFIHSPAFIFSHREFNLAVMFHILLLNLTSFYLYFLLVALQAFFFLFHIHMYLLYSRLCPGIDGNVNEYKYIILL